ncbi:MAG: hypothetical protein KIT33_11900 [Candidatus Kapabacteria bacterium]|nr:hypothetical protein [Ignavibacteriota bacterium]MCW5885663.1 hypothetical protein [Candidatus Kapabacteria bacterium]
MRKIHYLIVISVILLLQCCDNPTEPSKIKRILPLDKGNIWIYQEYEVKGEDSLVKYKMDTIKVLSDTIIDDFRFSYIKYFSRIFSFGYINDSLLSYVDPNYKLNHYLIYTYPCNVGDFYSSDFGLCKVENIDTTITVRAGKFRCIKYKFYARMGTGHGFDDYHYCSPGVGLIKIEHLENSHSQKGVFIKKSEKELISYNIKD